VVEKEGVAGDQILGAGGSLVSNAWASQNFTLDGATTWSSGDTMILKIKTYSRNNQTPKVADITLKMVTD
jgi:hypothetical protein